jgi:hypothetical protein
MTTKNDVPDLKNPLMLQAAQMLAEGRTPADVRQQLDLPAELLLEWRQQPNFAAAVTALRDAAASDAAQSDAAEATDAETERAFSYPSAGQGLL